MLHNLLYEPLLLKIYCFIVLTFLAGAIKVSGQVNNQTIKGLFDSTTIALDSAVINTAGLVKQLRISKETVLPIKVPNRIGSNFKNKTEDIADTPFIRELVRKRSLIKIKNGYINYNYSYRTNLDTPYIESNIAQHLATINADLLISGKYPVKFAIFERRTNSDYFRNYTDVRVEFNVAEFRNAQSHKLEILFAALTNQLQNSGLKQEMEDLQGKLYVSNNVLNQQDIVKSYLQNKEKIINKDLISVHNEQRDSIIGAAEAFVEWYEKSQKEARLIKHNYDSLKNEYLLLMRKVQQLRQVFKSNITLPDGPKIIKKHLNNAGFHDRRYEKLLTSLYAIRTLGIGRAFPDYTRLTIKNISINGFNAEYNNNNLYVALVAGFIDYRLRDFVTSKYENRTPGQYVTAARIGWGQKEKNYLILTGYRGYKQIFSSQASYHTIPVGGLSVAMQYIINKNLRVSGEVAQSFLKENLNAVPDSTGKSLALKNDASRAFSFAFYSYFPKSRTKIEGRYEYQGIQFQCFNTYKPQANSNAWNVKAEQYFFSGTIHLAGTIQKNEYANPFITQRYNSNTIFTSVSLTMRKRLWPVISIGYIPSSQYSIMNNQIFESRYGTLNFMVNHTYKLGLANAVSAVVFNRFYNDSKDSGFVYYNAQNLLCNQNIIFEKFSANIGVSHTQNTQYVLDVMSAGITKIFLNRNSLGGGIKLNHLNTLENKFGYYLNVNLRISKFGMLNVTGESGHLPGIGNTLVRNDFFNVGFTTRLN